MGILDFLTKRGANPADTGGENLRETVRNILQQIIVLENKIGRYEGALRIALKRGNDPAQIRLDITNAEIKKLDLERALTKIDEQIVAQEKAKVERMQRVA